MVMASLFHLNDLPPYRRPLDGETDLPAIAPTYFLPGLDDDAAGPERLLASLDRFWLSLEVSTPSRKGKEKEVLPPTSAARDDGRESVVSSRQTVWDQVREGEAGPSCGPVFEPLRTWDVLTDPDGQAVRLMSERPVLFEALAAQNEVAPSLPRLHPHYRLPKSTDEVISLMMRSTMGTTTTGGVTWDKHEAKFKWEGGRVEGLGDIATSSSTESFLEIGTAVRRLEMVIDTHSTTPMTPTHHAFFHAMSTYLTYLTQNLTEAGEKSHALDASLYGNAVTLKRTHELALLLCDIMCWPIGSRTAEGLPARPSSLLTHLYAYLLAHQSTSSETTPTALATAYLLSQTSGPFLSLLHGWLGLSPCAADEDLDPALQPWSDLGITRTPTSPAENGDSRWSFEFSSKRMPAFIPRESRRELFEAGKSLRLLREASGNHHPLCATEWGLEIGWGWGEQRASSSTSTIMSHVRRVKKDVERWRRSVRDRSHLRESASMIRLRRPQKERKRLPLEFTQASPQSRQCAPTLAKSEGLSDDADTAPPHSLDALWTQFSLAPGSHLDDEPTPLWAPSPLESLRTFLNDHSDAAQHLLPSDSPSLGLFISTHLLAPLSTHAKLVSTSLVSLYLDDLNLLDHYDILRSFFLGGNVGFAERVSAALFGKDEAGAGEALGLGKRARTRARLGLGSTEETAGNGEGVWGIGLGLGLSERQKWPPGGAELAYALRTTLVDDEEGRDGAWEGIEDKVGFGVRSLPEDEQDGQRARWMNPQAIEALDFLYLSYTAPSSISPLMPNSILTKYQSIHNLLLRLCRVKTVIRSLYLDAVHPTPLFDEPVKQGIDVGSNRARKAGRQARLMQTLLPTRSRVEYTLHRLRFRMSGFVAALEQYLLDVAIGSHWDAMRHKLEKLRRRESGAEDASPATPVDHEAYEAFDSPENNDSDDEAEIEGPVQLHSIDSLVVYHHLVLDRMLRASLLAPSAGHKVTFKVLMGLFGCILDLGKIVKEVERGVVGWEEGADRVEAMAREWGKRETIFLHAVERLSVRTPSNDKEQGQGDERDLEILLGQEGEEGVDKRVGADGGDLGELLTRLSFAGPMPGPVKGRGQSQARV